MSQYAQYSLEELMDLLFTEDDRLSREAVDECMRRGHEMVEPLAKLVMSQAVWEGDSAGWAPIHAAFILGAIGTSETLIPLLSITRYASAYDCDWVTGAMPAMLSKVGVYDVDLLCSIVKDRTTDWFVRATVMEGLAGTTIDHPELEEKVFSFILSIFKDKNEDEEVKGIAGNTLLDFLRYEARESLLEYGKATKLIDKEDFSAPKFFEDDDVKKVFAKGEKNLWCYEKNWLKFYDVTEIQKRQERWAKEDREEEESPQFVKVGRNEPCPCGSGKKFKKCCLEEYH